MTPNRWLFFPTQAAAGTNVTVTGNLAADLSSSVSESGLNNWAISGPDAADFDEYAINPFRRQGGYGYLELMIKVDTTATYASTSAFSSAVTLDSANSSVTLDGTTLSHNNFLLATAGSTILRFRFWGNTSTIQTMWDNGSAGDLVTFNLAWT